MTGGSRGIGRAIALKLAENGWQIAIHYRAAQAEADAVRDLLGDRFGGAYQADMAVEGDADRLWQAATAEGPVHALVNNAGVYSAHSFLDTSDADFEAVTREMFQVNFFSPLRLCRLAARAFQDQGGGSILNVASRVGFRGEAGASMYSASKAALINLTRALAVELAGKNIRSFGIAPGWVETSMAREGMENRLPQILKDIPLGRMASPQDCAEAAAFLLSNGAAYLSGVTIDINGASYFH